MSTTVPIRRKRSVPTVAREMGVAEKKVIGWIRSGELRALNLARSRDGRPRYAIDVADIEAFEQSRQVIPDGGASTTQRLRRRTPGNVKEFF
jgi:hypothetical protein